MTLKKLIILLLSLSMIMLTACKDGGQNTPSTDTSEENPTAVQGSTLQLLYCENDTINPYKTINKANGEIAQLIYEPLVKINSRFEPVLALAKSVETNGNICTVTLNDALFSDMSRVTAEDVVFSCSLAKASQRFAYLLYEVKNVYAVDSNKVAFELTKNDPFFKSLLTFPIIKAGTDNLKDEDNIEIAPVGCGRFVLSPKDSALLPFENYYGNKNSVLKIKLINAPDSESVEHFVESSATDIYYTDYSDANIYRMSGIRESVNLNNLVYIGINHNNSLLATDEMRYAISSALDKNEIVTKAFYGNGVAATGFFHPDFAEVSGIQTLQTTPNEKIVIENLEKIGYNSTDTKGIRKSPYGSRLSFNLLVNRDNPSKLSVAHLLSEQLKRVGIEIKINEVSSSQFSSLVSTGNFQLYIGEVKILPNMDISSLVLPGGSAAAGITSPVATSEEEQSNYTNKAYISVINGFYSGKNSIADVASSLISSMPVIPVIFRSGLIFHSDEITEIGEVSSTDLFLSLDNYKFKN